jgi:hypothetical protein
MGASSNFGKMFRVLGAGAFLPFLPMDPIYYRLDVPDVRGLSIWSSSTTDKVIQGGPYPPADQYRSLHL